MQQILHAITTLYCTSCPFIVPQSQSSYVYPIIITLYSLLNVVALLQAVCRALGGTSVPDPDGMESRQVNVQLKRTWITH